MSYCVQLSPDGLASAFILSEEFIVSETCAMVLGNSFFYRNGVRKFLRKVITDAENNSRATVFRYSVNDPERFGVDEFDGERHAISIEEKGYACSRALFQLCSGKTKHEQKRSSAWTSFLEEIPADKIVRVIKDWYMM